MFTAVVLTKNEEADLKSCLKTLSFVDEVIVVDDFSEDKTVSLAKQLGAVVHSRKLNNDFAAQRNFALDKAKPGWVLFVDADERVSPKLAQEMKLAIEKKDVDGFRILRVDTLFGRVLKHGEVNEKYLVRLAKRDSGRWQRAVHETWKVEGAIHRLSSPLLHYPHQSLSDFFADINHYSSIHARVLYKDHAQTSLFQILAYPTGKFFNNYFFRLGFLDGVPGLILALMMSFHSFLARGKLYMLLKKGPVEYDQST
ncbi:glycosyltransferase family 2 protein [Patescibacteria group bacterium]|nr:glycosyltransferase family 2 protein [Patescibacteria group bacterium]